MLCWGCYSCLIQRLAVTSPCPALPSGLPRTAPTPAVTRRARFCFKVRPAVLATGSAQAPGRGAPATALLTPAQRTQYRFVDFVNGSTGATEHPLLVGVLPLYGRALSSLHVILGRSGLRLGGGRGQRQQHFAAVV